MAYPPLGSPSGSLGLDPEQTTAASQEEPQLLFDTEEARTILSVVQEYDKQEQFVRLAQAKKWRKHLHYWNNLQYLAWDEVAHDWRTAEQILEDDPQSDIDPALYAKVVNIYKAHGEILIGALTAGVPTVRFFPRDADDHEDNQAARARTKIAELIAKQNRAKLLLMKTLFILYNQGLVACYNENKEDFRFGKITVPKMGQVPVVNRQSYCPSCGQSLGAQQLPPEATQAPPQPMPCPQCNAPVMPMNEDTPGTVTQQIGVEDKPKNRETLEIFGPMNVKIPIWARDQFSTPYLILETEEHASLLKEIYPEIADRIQSSDYPDSWDKEVRIPSLYKNDFPRGLCTVQRCWLRPWAFNNFVDPEQAAALKSEYPDGCYVVIINKSLVAEILSDKLDDHWTLSEQPLAEILHAEPIGSAMIPMQDIENELTNLTLETIEFGISEVFADPQTLDFDAYPRQEVRPGQVTPARAPAGQQLSGGFFEVKPASLSQEVGVFDSRLERKQQFVLGTYPSIFGGGSSADRPVARDQELSKAAALQRLTTTWVIVQEWWQKVIAKATDSFVKNMQQDEKVVKPNGSSFINVWIRRSELSGDVAELDPEISEQFPVSWGQKRDLFINLIGMKNPMIDEVIAHPENASLIASIVGVPELFIPGDDDRNKQLYEIAQLVQSAPQLGPPSPLNPMGGLVSTVQVTPELDNHAVEAAICRSWLKSEVGLDAKQNNPPGYANVLAHLKEHLYFAGLVQQQQVEQQAAMAPDKGPGKPGESSQSKNKQLDDVSPTIN